MANNIENYLNDLTVEGLDETFAVNLDVDEVEASTVLLTTFMIDKSGSMDDHEDDMRECLCSYKEAIAESKQSDEMLLSKVLFSHEIKTFGFVKPEDFDTSYQAGGGTKLYDAIIDHRKRLLAYMDELRENGTNVRAITIILSDGKDEHSSNHISDARKAIEDLTSKEVMVAFIAFGQNAFGIAEKLGINPKSTVEVTKDKHKLREVIQIASKNSIACSQKASTGMCQPAGFFEV